MKRHFTVQCAVLWLLIAFGWSSSWGEAANAGAQGRLVVVDDLQRTVTLSRPAQRIISLAPHITENLFSVGAGQQVVGAVDYSDYPEAARKIPRVGGYSRFNLEAIAVLKPDLVVGWHSGNGMGKLQSIIDMGLPVYVAEPRTLEDIATNLERLAYLSGNTETGKTVSRRFTQTLAELRQEYSRREKVSVFYQVWNKPLHTATDKHLIGDVIRLCGGRNVFAGLSVPTPTPTVSLESVLAANPQVIVASGMSEARPDWLDEWLQWPSLQAVQNGHLYFIPPDLVQRHTTRILLGAQQMCEHIQKVRLPSVAINHQTPLDE